MECPGEQARGRELRLRPCSDDVRGGGVGLGQGGVGVERGEGGVGVRFL